MGCAYGDGLAAAEIAAAVAVAPGGPRRLAEGAGPLAVAGREAATTRSPSRGALLVSAVTLIVFPLTRVSARRGATGVEANCAAGATVGLPALTRVFAAPPRPCCWGGEFAAAAVVAAAVAGMEWMPCPPGPAPTGECEGGGRPAAAAAAAARAPASTAALEAAAASALCRAAACRS